MPARSIVRAALACAVAGCGPTAIVTQHVDQARTGWNHDEVTLDVAKVSGSSFGKLFERDVEGQIYAQPLYLANATVTAYPNVHQVAYVATQRNKVYAFDAVHPSASAALWTTDLNHAGFTAEDVDSVWGDKHCVRSLPWVGVMSTPVIVRGSPDRMFLVSKHVPAGSTNLGSTFFMIHVINLSDGTVMNEANVTLPGFDPGRQLQRAALVYVPNVAQGGGGMVYAAFGSHCDSSAYHGWILGFNEQLGLVTTLNTTPTGNAGGVWQAGNGIVFDGQSSLFVATGNGDFNADTPGGQNHGSSYLRLAIGAGGALAVADWFTPYNWCVLNLCDADPASSGPVLLPNRNLLVGGGKEGVLYVLDPTNMGKTSGIPDAAFNPQKLACISQNLSKFVQPIPCTNNGGGGGIDSPPYTWVKANDPNAWQTFKATQFHIHGSPVVWEGPDGLILYLWSEQDSLVSYQLDGSTGKFKETPYHRSIVPAFGVSMPGGMLAVSSKGAIAGTGIVWATLPTADAWTPDWGTSATLMDIDTAGSAVPGILFAFDASDVTNPIWRSDTNGADALGNYAKFVAPMIADGQVFIATWPSDLRGLTTGHLAVYGMACPAACPAGQQCVWGQCSAN
jgi:hypothetical protein